MSFGAQNCKMMYLLAEIIKELKLNFIIFSTIVVANDNVRWTN